MFGLEYLVAAILVVAMVVYVLSGGALDVGGPGPVELGAPLIR